MLEGTQSKRSLVAEFFNELLLFSGQYALFYILMNFTSDKLAYFSNLGHTLLLVILIFQTAILVRFGNTPRYRFLGSLIAPLCYTLLEFNEGPNFLLNTAHVFFWIFSLITGFLQAFELKAISLRLKLTLEFLITTINVSTFIFIYFFYELKLSFADQLLAGTITESDYLEYLEIYNVKTGLLNFLSDSSHVYVVIGGLILSLSLSIGRVKIVQLKEKINELFGKYVDKHIRDRILTVHGSESQRKEIAILFSDIRNFTSISEHQRPDQITKMLNHYFSQWDESVTKYGGVIDKYIGDAIMVLFGINDDTSVCGNAVACAIDMLKKMDAIKLKLKEMNLPMIENIGVGINFGNTILGDIGSQQRKNFTVIGDTVNVASRLESLCRNYRVPLIISDIVYHRLNQSLKQYFRLLGETDIKGKSNKVSIYGLKTHY